MSTFAAICIAAGLPEPVPEYRFDPKRRWRADWCWVKQRLILEVEGNVWASVNGTKSRHFHGKGILDDMTKYNRAAELGYRVLRCSTSDFQSGAILETVARCLGVTVQ